MVLRDFNEKIQDPRLSILKVMHEVVFCLSNFLQGSFQIRKRLEIEDIKFGKNIDEPSILVNNGKSCNPLIHKSVQSLDNFSVFGSCLEVNWM